MGLLDDVFGKNEINQLKNQLIDKGKDILQLESQIAELITSNNDLASDLNRQRKSISEKDEALRNVTQKLDDLNRNHHRLNSEFESLRQQNSSQKAECESAISVLQAAIASTKVKSAEVKAERDAMEKDFSALRTLHIEKESRFQEREIKLAEKSERLLQERQKFQQQAAELHTREQHWKHIIEPQIQQYEAHASLDSRQHGLNQLQSQLDALQRSIDEREADMVRRQAVDEALAVREQEINEWEQLLSDRKAALDAVFAAQSIQQVEIDRQIKELNDLDRELSTFRERVSQLDEETSRISSETEKLDAKQIAQVAQHSERLAEIRRERTELRQAVKELNQREMELKTREKEIKREETAVITIKNKNFELRNEQKRLNSLVETLEAKAQEAIALKQEYEDLLVEHQALQTTLKTYQAKAKDAGKDRQEINRLTARIERLTQVIPNGAKFNSSLANPTVLAWLLEEAGPDETGIENGWLGSSGHGPWPEQELETCLTKLGYEFYQLPDADLKHLIVGRKGWSKSDLLAQIEATDGGPLRIYSQEMFFAKLITGRDPFEANDDDLMDAFAEDHPALQFLLSLPSPWPEVSTEVSAATEEESEAINEVDGGDLGVSESPLHILGYKVGVTSDLSILQRRKILTECFMAKQLEFSHDSDDDYIAKWGRGGGAQRLYRMAIHIRLLADGRVGKDYRKPQARIDWTLDLEWLREKYYPAHRIKFTWP